MAHKLRWEYVYLVRDENGRQIAEFSTLEAALALVGDDIGVGMEYSGGDAEGDYDEDDDADYSWDLYDGAGQVPVNLFDNRDENSSSSEPHLEEPRNPRPGKRPRRTTFQFTTGQVQEMEKLYEETPNPDAHTMKQLAIALNVREVKVKMWFENRRAKDEKNEMSVVLQSTGPRIKKIIRLKNMDDSP